MVSRRRLHYTGQVLTKSIFHGSSDAYVTEYYSNFYDHAGRLSKTYHRLKISNTFLDSVCLESNTYNELGKLSTSSLANGNENQSLTYNIRGWLTGISGNYFGQNLYYDTKRDGSIGLFNGNISQQDIHYRAGGHSALVSLEFDNTYDQLSRLTNSSVSGDFLRYGENISYDKHGNITGHVRGGIVDHGWTSESVPSPNHNFASVDMMSYTYNGNQVTSIHDSGNSAIYTGSQDFKNNSVSSDEYSYDANGNMIKDLNKEIVTMNYNSLNLPDTIQLEDGHMESYIYDASGNKEQITRATVTSSNVSIPVGKTLNNSAPAASRVYSYTKYASNLVYNDTHISDILLPNGIIKRTNSITTNPPVFTYYYYIKDNLGNIRAVIDGSGSLKQVNNYYPFGMEYGESGDNQTMMTFQDYQYSGKEFDRKFEINLYDFHARRFDATRGQWLSPDPMAEKYYSISPYVYCGNNPLMFVDPDGKDARVAIAGNVIIISSNIYLYGNGATKAVASQMQQSIMKEWNNGLKESGFDVRFDVNVNLYDGKERSNPFLISESWNPSNRDNFIEVSSDTKRSYVLGGDEGKWRADGRNGQTLAQDNPAPHEFGHLLGLNDQYTDKGGSK